MKNIDKKRKVQLFIIFMITIALLAGSVTYALIELNIIYRGNQENTISSCSFNIDIKENNPINLVSTYPMDDNEATKLEPYKFSITPNSQTCNTLKYNITVVSNCDSCTKTNGICNDNNLCNCNDGYQIDPNLIKYELTNKTTGEKTVGINPYKMGVADSMTVGTTINFELRMWIINSATNDDLYIKENGSYKEDSNGLILTKNFCSKVKITGTDDPTLTQIDISGANAPVLASNMIPVYYDETSEVWKKANVSNNDLFHPWYSYNSTGDYKGMWANAVTVKDTNRQTYLNATPGTIIPMDDITTMWVWIPRFKVNTTNFSSINGIGECEWGFGNTESECIADGGNWYFPNPQAIDITFTKLNETAIDAFTFGDKELSGFWYGKFETSHTTLASSTTDNNLGCTNETCSNANGIIIKPNVKHLTSNNISNFFFASRSMEQPGNSFGFVSSEVDTHMSKNNEWGAVAYLTQSIYGRCINSTTCTAVDPNSDGSITGIGEGTDFYYSRYQYNQNLIESTIVDNTGTNVAPTITNDSVYPWASKNGVYSSENSVKDTTSSLTFTFTLTKKGAVLFDLAISSDTNGRDMFSCQFKRGTKKVSFSCDQYGEYLTDESQLEYYKRKAVLEPGTYTLEFQYEKNSNKGAGLEKAFVKNFTVLENIQTIDKSTPQGQLSSTTGNVYGIYDMNGRSEYIMGVLADENGKPRSGSAPSFNSGFNGMLFFDDDFNEAHSNYTEGLDFPDSKYYNLYVGTSYEGHALTETQKWYNSDSHNYFVTPNVPWFMRSSTNNGYSYSIFDFDGASMGGGGRSDMATRYAMTNE